MVKNLESIIKKISITCTKKISTLLITTIFTLTGGCGSYESFRYQLCKQVEGNPYSWPVTVPLAVGVLAYEAGKALIGKDGESDDKKEEPSEQTKYVLSPKPQQDLPKPQQEYVQSTKTAVPGTRFNEKGEATFYERDKREICPRK